MKHIKLFEGFINERSASAVGKYHEPDYSELMDLLDMSKQYINTNLRAGKNFKLYYNSDLIMFDNVDGVSVGYDKRNIRKKNIFPGKSEVIHTFKKANYAPELTKKEVEKRSNGKISVEMATWQGEVIGVNYIFK